MKQITRSKFRFVIVALVVITSTLSYSQTILHTADFESNTDGWTLGGIDAIRTNSASWSYSNSYSINVQDNSGIASAMDSPLFSLSAYDKVDFKFFFSAYDMESGEDFFVEYRDNGAAAWTTVETFVSNNVSSKNADFQKDDFSAKKYSKTVTLLKTNHIFPAAATAQFRVRCDASDNNDRIYVDLITITGTVFTTPTKGPGGITSDLDLWLKADQLDGSSYGTDAANVNKWTDNGKGNHAETVVSGQEPVYRNNFTKNFNFNPVIEFENDNNTSGSDMSYIMGRDELKGTGGFNSNDIFMVVRPDPTITSSMIPLDTFTSKDPTGQTYQEDVTGFGYGGYTQRFVGEYFTYAIGTTSGVGNGYGRADLSGTNDYNKISIVNVRHDVSNSIMEMYLNCNQVGDSDSDLPDYASVNNTKYWIGRSQYWNGSFDGRIAEIITYNSRKNNATERNKIESYLGIKYGITLGINGTSQDYVDSSAGIIWNQSANVGFNYDIAGIGRDDESELNQKQSSSVNDAIDGTGPIEGILTMGLTDIYDTNSENIITNSGNTFNDKEFLVWGNDHADLNLPPVVLGVDMSAGIAGLSTPVTFLAMQRIWKVVETGGDVSKVKISIPQNAVRNISPPGSYLMFISNSVVFDPTADYRVMTLNGGILETEYDFDGTKFITFGYAPQVIVERSIKFDGAVDYVDMEDNLDLNPTDFTISAWIKRDVGSANSSILSKRDAAYTQGYDFKINATGHFEMSWKNGLTQSITSSTVIPQNEWHQVAVIYSGGTATIYIDGVADGTAALSAPVATNESFYIAAAGKNTPTAYYNGNIDEVRVWDAALSPDQLHYIMNQEIEDNASFASGTTIPSTITKNEVGTIPWTDLAGYYPMSVYTYTNTNDDSGNNNQGALRNLDTVDFQTAPLPYESEANGPWTTDATWLNNTVQALPNSLSIVDGTTPIDWNIVETNHNITIDTDAVLGRERSVLALMVKSGDIQINGSTPSGTGNGLTVSHYLELDGTIDLEGESQLIQTDGSDLDVTSSGSIERDQQGTADLYTYNYWSSPVGAVNITTNNQSYTIPSLIKDGTTPASPLAITYLTSGYDGTSGSPIGIADFWIWKFANQLDDDYSLWQHIRSTGNMLVGEGFTMKGPGTGSITTPQNYVYNGKPNNADISVSITAGNDYLVGNPYPSALDAHEFLDDNPLTGGTLYFWEHWGGGSHLLGDYQGGYAQYNYSGGSGSASYGTNDPDVGTGGTPVKLPGRYIPVAQGFFVYGSATGTINFENDQRAFIKESASSVFVRSAENRISEETDERMKFRIGFNSINQIHRQLLLTVDDNATSNADWGYDGVLKEMQMDDMYWMIQNDKYIIQGTNLVNNQTVVPLGIHTRDDGLNMITIDKLENVPDDLDIYVFDKELSIHHNLRQSDYEVFLTAGEYLNRFEIIFNDQLPLNSLEKQPGDALQIYYSNTDEELIIFNPEQTSIYNLEILNILGQSIQIIDKLADDLSMKIKVRNLSSGAYIIRLSTGIGPISKRVLVKR